MASYFLPENLETGGGALSNMQKMQAFLRYVADPGFQVGVGEDLGIHQTTVCRANWIVCQHIMQQANEWIHFPETLEEMESAKNDWAKKFKFRSAIGALDCTHVLILKPKDNGDEYINRKGLASFNIQVTCDAKEYVTCIDSSCRWAGSVHDSRIWQNSFVQENMNENLAGAILLGDEGYGITPWLMTPYRNPMTISQGKYNKLHCKERVIIESIFGQIKRRFPILQSKMRTATAKIPSMIGACFILHNVAKYLREPEFEDDVVITESENIAPINYPNDLIRRRGQLRRDYYVLN